MIIFLILFAIILIVIYAIFQLLVILFSTLRNALSSKIFRKLIVYLDCYLRNPSSLLPYWAGRYFRNLNVLWYSGSTYFHLRCCWKKLWRFSLQKMIALALIAGINKTNFADLSTSGIQNHLRFWLLSFQ